MDSIFDELTKDEYVSVTNFVVSSLITADRGLLRLFLAY